MQAKDLHSGDKFTVWEHERHTICLKMQDGRTYRVKDGSVIELAHNKRVDLLQQEERGFQVAEYHGQLVLAKRLDGAEGASPRYVVKTYLPVETSFVLGDVQGLPDIPTGIRKESQALPTMSPQVLLLLHELEQALSRGTGFLQVILMLLQQVEDGGQVYHNPVMVNLPPLPPK